MKQALPYIYWFLVTCAVLATYFYLASKNVVVYVEYDNAYVISPDPDNSTILFKKCEAKQ